MYTKIRKIIEADIEELVAKGSLEPHEYKCLSEAIDIVKDTYKIEMMQMDVEPEMVDASGRVYRGGYRFSNERGRSPVTGRYVSRDGSYDDYHHDGSPMHSYHDPDGSIRADLQEVLNKTTGDHERMLLMKAMDKLDHK